ncbi:MAG: ATP-dependent DNA helicase RecG [Candidatus Riflebacteria bacterium]|nr:ATP-dependent DNA helicase RecG [Candidatus Riflebacteria bacterium]
MMTREGMLAWLRKVLVAERAGGFRDRAVVGGLARLIGTMREWEAREQASALVPTAFIRRVQTYARVAPPSRPAAIASLERMLDEAGTSTPVARTPPPEPKGESRGPRAAGRLPGPEPLGSSLGVGSRESGVATQRAGPEPGPGLASPITALRGVKEERARLLDRLGVRTVGDLVWLLPVRHEDRSRVTPISELVPAPAGDGSLAHVPRTAPASVIGTVTQAVEHRGAARKVWREATVQDPTGTLLAVWFKQRAVWFNQPWLAKAVRKGTTVRLHGPVRLRPGPLTSGGDARGAGAPEPDHGTGTLEMRSPELELDLDAGGAPASDPSGLVPIYPLTEGLHQKTVRRAIREALRAVPGHLPDALPPRLVQERGLLPPDEALLEVHRPTGSGPLERAWRRLRFEELFFLELAVAVRRHLFTVARPGVAIKDSKGLVDRLRHKLPFRLTGAQERAVDQILADLEGPRAMARLVQGDVGSGKTAVALAALMAAAGADFQGALMAPTEILAGQHFLAIRRLCADLGVRVELLVGSQSARERREAVEAVASGDAALAVGTHALLEGEVEFRSLGLVVIDEQHRFGVNQRARLKLKGENPNLLVMTATPIPRTLALTLYGDLDVSVLDEMPPGRQPIRTRALPMERVGEAYELIRREVAAGRQAYVVCALVEESETLEVQAAERTYAEVRTSRLPDLRAMLLHGRMPGVEKARVMDAMRRGEADVLVATTVVEVGVDIPNATVMVVLDADRFGLAQLHQLRGRIGRGSHPSVFFPVTAVRSRTVRQRMSVLEKTCDGFEVAEKDLELRGPGEFFGTRQAGLEVLRVASLPRDLALLESARQEAFRLIARDPHLSAPELAATREQLFSRYGAYVDRRH